MISFFEKLPLNSFENLMDSVFKKQEKSQIPELEKVLKSINKPSDILKNLTLPDDLTKSIYQTNEKGRIVFPKVERKKKWWNFKRNKQEPKEHMGYVGDQTSAYHKENLKQQASLMVKKAEKAIGKSHDLDALQLTALFANIGRKYTAKTSDIEKFANDDLYIIGSDVTGQVMFPGQEKLSAYLAARYFKQYGLDEDFSKPYIAAIYHQPAEMKGKDEKQTEEEIINVPEHLEKLYGDEACNVYLSLSAINKGVINYRDLANVQVDISAGEKIVREELDPFVTNIVSRKPRNVAEIDKKFFASSQFDEFEKDAREEQLREQRKKQEENQRKINQQTYEEIIEGERIMVEEQRQLERETFNKIANLDTVLSMATLQAMTEKEERKKRQQELASVEQDFIDLDGDGIDDRLEGNDLDISL